MSYTKKPSVVKIDPTVTHLQPDQFDNDDPIQGYPFGTSAMRVTTATGFPETSGDVITSRTTDDRGSQIFIGEKAYIRTFETSAWSSWRELGESGGGGPVEWDDILNKPSQFPPSPHTHDIEDTIGLQAALDDKASAQSVNELQQEVDKHKEEDVTEPQGVHGIRVQNGQLEYWDKDDQEWKRIAGQQEAKIYGLEWNQTLDTYQRLDDAVGMVAVTQGQNDFSDVYPWSEMKRCNLDDNGVVQAYFGDPAYADDGSNGQVMVQIPKFWYKSEMINEDGNKIYRWWIADNPVDGFKLHPAFIRNGVEKDLIYIGAYEGYVSGGMLHSRAGVMPTVNRTIVQFRNDAQARGSIWHQQDFLTTCAIQLLYLIEYAHFDSQTKIGRGITSDSNFHQTGETAQYGNESYGTVVNEATAMSYRGIENLYGNVWKWVDGININNRRAYIADHNFQSDKFDGHYRQVGFTNATANGYVKDIGWTELDDFMFLAIDTTGSASSYLHDYYWQNTGARVARFGGFGDLGANAGAFCWDLLSASSGSFSYVGTRLMCIP